MRVDYEFTPHIQVVVRSGPMAKRVLYISEQARDYRHALGGGQNRLYKHFGVAKALFCYVSLLANNYVEGCKTMKNFSFGSIVPMPSAVTCLCQRQWSFKQVNFASLRTYVP